MALQLRSHCRKPLQNACISRFFSSSSSGGEDDKTPPSSSYLSSIKASLRQSSQSPPRSGKPNSPPPFPPPRPSKIASLEEIRKNLSEFRRRSAAPPSPEGHDASSPPSISFQDLYKRNVIGQGNADASTDTKKLSLESIRESLRQLRASSPAAGIDPRRGKDDSRPSPLSLSALKESLKLKPTDVSGISSDSLRTSLFGRDTGEAKTEADSQASRTEFVKMYSYGELGEKLKKLRPPEAESKKKKDWFSIVELNERLKKLREIEEKETESRIGGVSFKDLRDSLVKLKNATDASTKKQSMQRLAMLGQLGGQVTPSFMLSPPKDELVEKYFHPDNMSLAEKLKLELKRVREEFKMSESDCGSSRVQVALLTTKIKHLSSVLHKKDKHSRKGLQAMVQRRKKLLKYLRRTDWDSYCFVLSKLGLRDNPGIKN